jgi:uncharacterized membrane protein YfcA
MELLGLENSWLAAVILGGLGAAAYVVSNLSGGGGSLILVPILSYLVGAKAVAPVLNLGELIGEPVRVWLFWKHVRWDITRRYLPGAIVGAVAAALLFKSIEGAWLKILIGIFLVSTLFQYRLGKREKSFPMKLAFFAPLGLFVGFFSTLIGSMGPILNPFYLNCGVDKEALIGTKTVNSFALDIVQIGLYMSLGILSGWLWAYGIAIGLGAIVGNVIGKKLLASVSSDTFRRFVVIVMALSGVAMIVQEARALVW